MTRFTKVACNVSNLSERETDIVKTWFSPVRKGTSLVWGPLNFPTDAGVTKGLMQDLQGLGC